MVIHFGGRLMLLEEQQAARGSLTFVLNAQGECYQPIHNCLFEISLVMYQRALVCMQAHAAAST
jgi:hypothetical protein